MRHTALGQDDAHPKWLLQLRFAAARENWRRKSLCVLTEKKRTKREESSDSMKRDRGDVAISGRDEIVIAQKKKKTREKRAVRGYLVFPYRAFVQSDSRRPSN